jgi:hypothetical protein
MERLTAIVPGFSKDYPEHISSVEQRADFSSVIFFPEYVKHRAVKRGSISPC